MVRLEHLVQLGGGGRATSFHADLAEQSQHLRFKHHRQDTAMPVDMYISQHAIEQRGEEKGRAEHAGR